ncbi:MAG: hypothetical protein GX614_00325 [Sandaracinaceae bacterium]|nr:hypothetical protein [Sandaracinaceae bacterium]
MSFRSLLFIPLTLFFVAASPVMAARAQAPAVAERNAALPKGTIGLGLIGAELGLGIPAALRVKNPFILAATGVVGAAGGALAGYYLVDRHDSSQVSRILAPTFLAVGIAGFIPTTILIVRASRYHPPRDEPGSKERALAAGGGLVRIHGGTLALGLPFVGVQTSTFDHRTRETHVSLVSGRF